MARRATKSTVPASTISTSTSAPVTESPKVARARATRAKADIQDAFDEMAAETASQEAVDPKFTEVMRANEDRIRKSVAGLTVEKTIQSLSTVGLEISRGLNQVSEILTQKLSELQDVTDAVNLHRDELARLHKIDVAATAIDNLVADYNKKNSELDVLINERKTAWAKEEQDHARFIRERNEEAEKTRRREQGDYEYTKAQERKFAQDAFEAELKKQDKAAREKQETLEKNWALREETLKARENELISLRAQVEAFPETLKKEKAAAEAILSNTMKKAHETEMTLIRKDMETNVKLMNQQIVALQSALEKQVEQTIKLQDQLAAEKKVAQDVVLKALDSASDQRALREVTNFAAGRDSTASAKK